MVDSQHTEAACAVGLPAPFVNATFRYTFFLGSRLCRDNLERRQCSHIEHSTLRDSFDQYPHNLQEAQPTDPAWFAERRSGVYCSPVLMDVGCGHCGTNSMYNYFAAHKLVSVAARKPMMWVGNRELNATTAMLYRSVFAPAAPDRTDAPYGVDVSEGYFRYRVERHGAEYSNAQQIALNIDRALPYIKLLFHVRDPLDRFMSLHYTTNGTDYHHNFMQQLHLGKFQTVYENECCYVNTLESYLRVIPGDRMLVLETQRLFWHRDEVWSEILTFAGIPYQPLNLPTIINCKADRYHGGYAGCYAGMSRVLPETRRAYQKLAYATSCDRRLASFLRLWPQERLFGYTPSVDDRAYSPPERR
jgi:hypothetical protein